MNPLYSPLTATQRDAISSTGDMLALLPLPGCRDLSHHLDCIAQTRRPDPTYLTETLALGTNVHRALSLDASPDRWLDDVAGFDAATQTEIIADLIAQRQAQADQLATTLHILRTATVNRTANA